MWQTIGQLKAIAYLESNFRTGNLSHAYLFAGPPHVGKMTLALDLSQALNCDQMNPPCGICSSCKKIINGKHVDVQIIGLNALPKNAESKIRFEIGIDDIRRIQQQAFLPPYEGKHKVFIIDGAELLTNEASNCLLKILEEPPARVMFLLLTSDESRLLSTIMSRCQRIELRPAPSQEIEELLIKTRGVTSDNAQLLARLSQGRIGWALSASMDASYIEQRNEVIHELLPLLKASLEERFNFAAQFEGNRKSTEDTLNIWLSWWRDVLLVKNDCEESVTNVDFVEDLCKWANSLHLSDIRNFITYLLKSRQYISQNANLRLIAEVLMLQMPREEANTSRESIIMTG
jgi:DNA polymerase III subunit delta'